MPFSALQSSATIRSHFNRLYNSKNAIQPYILLDNPNVYPIRARLRFHCLKTNYTLWRWKFAPSPFCPSCPHQLETLEHLFMTCPRYDDLRFAVIQALGDFDICLSLALLSGNLENIQPALRKPVLQVTGDFITSVVKRRDIWSEQPRSD